MSRQNSQKFSEGSIVKELGGRLIFLMIAFVSINLWVSHHLEMEGWYVLLIHVMPLGYGLLTFMVGLAGEAEEKEMKKILREALLFFLRPQVLLLIYFVILICILSISSIKVYADGQTSHLELHLSAEGSEKQTSKTLDGPNSIVSFLRFTSPFGISYYLQAPGYQRKSFELYPWFGKRIKLGEDMELTPGILVRLPDHKNKYREGRLIATIGEDTLVHYRLSEEPYGAFIIGRKMTVSNSWRNEWKNELDEITDNEQYKSRLINGWADPYFIELKSGIDPGSTILLQFLNRKDSLVAEKEILVSDDPSQNFLMDRK